MATQENPYRNDQDWDALIAEVNEVLQTPVGDDCDPIDPIPEVGPKYRWKKSDLRDMQEKIKETCPDIEFEPIPEGKVRWAQSYIDEIRDKLGEAWCDCEPVEGFDCCNCANTSISQFYDDAPKTQRCPLSSAGGCPVEPETVYDTVVALSNQAHEKLFEYIEGNRAYCYQETIITIRENQIQEIKDDLERLRELAEFVCASGNPTRCERLQTEIQELEAEQSLREAQRDAARAAQEEARALRDGGKSDCESLTQEAWSEVMSMGIPQMSPSPVNVAGDFLSAAGSHPWTCIEDCEGPGSLLCAPEYGFQTKTTGSWTEHYAEFYTPLGTPMPPPDGGAIQQFLATWGSVCFTANPTCSQETSLTAHRLYRVVVRPPECHST